MDFITGRRSPACVLAALLLLAARGAGAEELLGAKKGNEPIRITAKRMEVRAEINTIVFSENVVAVQGDITITCDRLKVVSAKGEGGENKVQEMTATGNVQFRQYFPEQKVERFATGEKAQYWDDEGKLVLTGNPKAWEGDNIITSEIMTFYTRENRFDADTQVKVFFYPEKEEGGQPKLGTAPEEKKPAAPLADAINVAASDGAFTDKIRVTWNVLPDASSYEVWRNTWNDTATAVQTASELTVTEWDDTTAQARQTYYYWVKATNAAGTSDFATFDTGLRAAPPPAPAAAAPPAPAPEEPAAPTLPQAPTPAQAEPGATAP